VIKFFAMLDTPFWLILTIVLVCYIVSLRRRIAGLKDPRLYLSKGERRAWARKELAQREQDYDLAQFQKNLDIVQGNPTPKENQ
jgi:hypothetical protein